MKRIPLSLCIAALALSSPAHASNKQNNNDALNVMGFINSLTTENTAYYKSHKSEFFAKLSKGQYPTATVVSCSDARVHSNVLSANPEGKLYVVRDLGNQISTAEGSVEYGIRQLHTPLLLILGHSRCGAIAAVTGNYSKQPPAIKRELDSIHISKELTNLGGVSANINNQVADAMLKFSDVIEKHQLTVVGAILDFSNDMHQGAGKLNIINMNGETSPTKLHGFEGPLPQSE